MPRATQKHTTTELKQLPLFKKQKLEYGGELRTKRNARGARPLATKSWIHLTIRASCATGEMSMLKHVKRINKILEAQAQKHGVTIERKANVGNHLHMKIKLANRTGYKRFIKAITAAIRMLVTGASRIKKFAQKFWDHRPHTRIIVGFRAELWLNDYIEINLWEAAGCTREQAREFVKRNRSRGP